MVHRQVEKSLQLWRVQIHRQDAIGAGRGDEVGHQFGGDWRPAGVLAVLACVAEVGNHGGDAIGTGAFEGVDVNQQLHQMRIDWMVRGLNHKTIPPTNVFLDPDDQLAIGKHFSKPLSDGHVQVRANRLAQTARSATAEDLQGISGIGGCRWHEVDRVEGTGRKLTINKSDQRFRNGNLDHRLASSDTPRKACCVSTLTAAKNLINGLEL